MRVNATQYLSWDFGGTNTSKGLELNGNSQFKNFWNLSTGISLRGNEISNADLRGGPSIIYPGRYNQWVWIGSDNRKKFRLSFNPRWTVGFDNFRTWWLIKAKLYDTDQQMHLAFLLIPA